MKIEPNKQPLTDEFLDWEERDSTQMSLFRHCVAGSIAGIAEHLTLYPVDTLKVSITHAYLTRL